jgi:parallel beta-helix repeat protein
MNLIRNHLPWSAAFAITLLCHVAPAGAATVYVWQGSPSSGPPYTDWRTAAHSIQEAVDAAQAGDRVVVTNGIYSTGGRAVYGTMTNRVAVDKPVRVESVNGPQVTAIRGYQLPITHVGDGAIRCVYLTNGAVLSGFTLTNGATLASGAYWPEQSGGGLFCESTNAVVTNCTLTGNRASQCGGGACYGTLSECTIAGNSAVGGGGVNGGMLNNCTLTGNSVSWSGGGAIFGTLNNCTLAGNSAHQCGGGAYCGTLNNCTLIGNSASWGGGASGDAMGQTETPATLNNCILYYNRAYNGPNYGTNCTLNYCCTTPMPTNGYGNIVGEPQLASASHLSAGSPCRGAGSAAYATGLDIDGEPWLSPPSIGCDEYRAGAVTGALSVAIGACWTNVAVGFALNFTGRISGRVAASGWDFGDGMVLSNRPYASHAWLAAGTYAVMLRAYSEGHPEGISALVTVQVEAEAVQYVSGTSGNPVPPYTSWQTAARTIQEAVDVAAAGARVLVTNGVYATGGRAVYGTMTNRVAVDKPVRVESVNGPSLTGIEGYQVPRNTLGEEAVRCVYLTGGAVLDGFTLTNGATHTEWDDYNRGDSGGGVWCESADAVVTNCTVTGNSASWWGAGVFGGTLRNCTLTNNAGQYGGGAYGDQSSPLVLHNCTLTGNWAMWGGGAYGGVLNNCTLTGNRAGSSGGGGGGGAFESTLNNCTVTSNAADDGGGAFFGTLNNCIVYYNMAFFDSNYLGGTFNDCCTTPLPGGAGNITNEPLFLNFEGGNLRLQSNSPCINAGANGYVSGRTDMDGLARIVAGTVDIGAYEFQSPSSIMSYAWLGQYGLPTDGSADHTDLDGDGLNNWQEWQADTSPTDPASHLSITGASAGPPVSVFLESSATRLYTLLFSKNGTSGPWLSVPAQTDIPGTGGTLTLTNLTSTAPCFYRVSVRVP